MFKKIPAIVSAFALSAISVSTVCISSVCHGATDVDGSNTATTDSAYRDADRTFRRLIPEVSLANAGYEGGDSTRYSSPNGFAAGFMVDLFGKENLVMELGALYRQFGTTYSNGVLNNKYTADYISIPLTAKYYFSGQEVTSFFLKAGVMGSTLVSKNSTYQTPTTQIGARSWETAFVAGLGGKISMTDRTDFVIEADYSRSIDSVLNGANVYRSDLSGVLGVAINL